MTLFYALVAGAALAAGWLLMWSAVPARVAGVALITVLIWLLRPHSSGFPPPLVQADRETFPTLNLLVQQIADAIGVQPPAIVLSAKFDAAMGRIGWSAQPMLEVGHPLLAVLEPDEIVTLLAHELGHLQDPAWLYGRGYRLARASNVRLLRLTNPRGRHGWRPLAWPLLPLHLLAAALHKGFARVTAAALRACELRADRTAREIGGPIDVVALHDKFGYGLLPAVRAAYLNSAPAERTAALRAAVARCTPDALAAAAAHLHTCGTPELANHPPLAERLQNLAQPAAQPARVTIGPATFATLQYELTLWPVEFARREAALHAADETTESAAFPLGAAPGD